MARPDWLCIHTHLGTINGAIGMHCRLQPTYGLCSGIFITCARMNECLAGKDGREDGVMEVACSQCLLECATGMYN